MGQLRDSQRAVPQAKKDRGRRRSTFPRFGASHAKNSTHSSILWAYRCNEYSQSELRIRSLARSSERSGRSSNFRAVGLTETRLQASRSAGIGAGGLITLSCGGAKHACNNGLNDAAE